MHLELGLHEPACALLCVAGGELARREEEEEEEEAWQRARAWWLLGEAAALEGQLAAGQAVERCATALRQALQILTAVLDADAGSGTILGASRISHDPHGNMIYMK